MLLIVWESVAYPFLFTVFVEHLNIVEGSIDLIESMDLPLGPSSYKCVHEVDAQSAVPLEDPVSFYREPLRVRCIGKSVDSTEDRDQPIVLKRRMTLIRHYQVDLT